MGKRGPKYAQVQDLGKGGVLIAPPPTFAKKWATIIKQQGKTPAQQTSARKAVFLNLSISMNQTYLQTRACKPAHTHNYDYAHNQTPINSFTFVRIISVGVTLTFIFPLNHGHTYTHNCNTSVISKVFRRSTILHMW